MKILHVNGTSKGGAANFALNIHNGLIKRNIKSYIYLPNKIDNKNIFFPKKNKNWFSKLILKSINKIFFKSKETFNFGLIESKDLKKKIIEFDPDLINIHWIGNEFMSLNQIQKLQKPIVITIHDMWFFLPIHHYIDDNFKVNFFKNFFLKFFLNKKKKLNEKIIKYIFTSKWMKSLALKSKIIKDENTEVIGCGIDFKNWYPIDKFEAKKKLGIKTTKNTILFSAFGLKNKRKGFKNLINELKETKDQFKLIISSDQKPDKIDKLDFIFFDDITNIEQRRLIYSSADICVVPSTQEAFGLVALEATACDVPLVVYSDNGLSEIVKHKKNGYIVNLHENEKLLDGIYWVIKELKKNPSVFKNSRELSKRFDIDTIIDHYISVYKNLLKNEKV